MGRIKVRRILIVTASLILLICAAGVWNYKVTLHEAANHFARLQSSLVQTAVLGLEDELLGKVSQLRYLNILPVVEYVDEPYVGHRMDTSLAEDNTGSLLEAFRVNESGRIVAWSSRAELPRPTDDMFLSWRKWAVDPSSRDTLLVDALLSAEPAQDRIFVIAPTYEAHTNPAHPVARGRFRGFTAFSLSLNHFIHEYLVSAQKASPDSFVCVLDRDGKFLFNSRYPELKGSLLDEAIDPGLRGREFAYHRALREDRGSAIEDLPIRHGGHGTLRQVVSWSTAKVGDQRLLVIFHIPHSAVIRSARSALLRQLALLIALLGAVLAAAWGLLRNERLSAATREKLAARRSEERYRQLVEQAADGILVVDNSGRIQEVNPTASSMLKYSRDILLEQNFQDLFAFGKIRRQPLRVNELEPGGRMMLERSLIMGDGKALLTELSAARLSTGQIQVIVRSIEERKKAETEHRKAEAKYRSLVENLPAATYMASLDEHRSTIYVSPQIQPLLGFSLTKWASTPDLWRKQVHPEDRERVLGELAESRERSDPFRSEYRMVGADGRVVWLQDQAVVVKSDSGEGLFFQGFMSNITDLRLAERAIRDSEERYRLLYEHNPVPMWVADQSTLQFLSVNESAVQRYGYSQSEFLRMTLRDIRLPEHVSALEKYLGESMQNGRSSGVIHAGQWRHRTKQGELFDVEIRWTLIEYLDRKAYLACALPIEP